MTTKNALPVIDPGHLRECLGSFVTGVTVVTTVDRDGQRHGCTANSFSSVSLDPPLVLWSQRVAAGSFPAFSQAERFAINILSSGQKQVAEHFARPADDKFAGIPVRTGLGGIPLIDDCAAYVECQMEASYPGGDHGIFLGRVERIEHTPDRKPLAFGNGKYLVTDAYDLGPFSPDLALASPARLDVVREATHLAEELARDLDRTVGLAVWGNHGPTMIRWEESSCPVSINLRTGLVLPLLSSATGLVFAAHLPPAWTAQLTEQELLTSRRDRQLTAARERENLEQTLAEVRQHGMSRVIGNVVPNVNERGINAFSVPVFDRQGFVVCALTIMGHADRMPSDWDSASALALKQRAGLLSQRIGSQR
ncbi:flavin reductase-like protein [Rhodococcus opacus M213]|uniref:Flavin reductase-like protein n=1 Tax=Rhodococcus opacus M213 TaxID=1129896 RepID=K8XU07_RHOOP|nr:flavin reductase [Rhodococcus opacus]EKT84366.1 flavin reductase-like protein [Rhodococcus opacus M213]